MKKKNLIYSLLKIYSLVLIVVITSFAIIMSYVSLERNRNEADQSTQQTAGRLATVLSDNEKKISQMAVSLADNQEKVTNLVNYFNLSYSNYLSYSLSQQNVNKDANYIYLPNQLMNFYYSDDKIEAITIELKDYQEILYSNINKKMGEKRRELPDFSNRLTLPKVLTNPNTSQQMGTLYVTFSEEELARIIDNYGTKDELQVFIFSDTMKNLYHSQAYQGNNNLQKQLDKSIAKSSTINFTELKKDYFINESKTSSGIQIVTAISKERVRNNSINGIIFILIGSVLINLFLLYFLYRTFSKYAQQVADIVGSVNQVSSGKMDWRIDTTHKEAELKDISMGINHMLDGVNQYIEDIYKLEIKQQDAHMRALQSQINPHFLYNTLEYIRMYAVSEGAEELADVVYTFATLLRNNTSQEKTTSLKKELEFCEKYVYLYQMRYPGNIAYSFYLDKSLENLVIPKFSIQPLIENYFVHGIDYMRINNVISVKAQVANGKTMILIRDNGKGMSAEKQEELNQSLAKRNSKMGDSIGILNVNERLSSFFGENYQMQIEKSEHNGVMIVISF
ncbi:sensor histidine kinase [Carnobacterium gallinarum]|uniref:sensor histidine kinase n=1 Tax=Carnobacterium gallinarum TaxID=2749 RepID=UPI0005554847|nr:sensor histidine kinase [Carnobacterium gallinarum]